MRFLPPAELRGLDSSALEDLFERSEMIVAAGDGEVHGLAAAALFYADYSALDAGASLRLDEEAVWVSAAWRIGRKALLLCIDERTAFTAAEARELGLCDEVFDGDAQVWFERWMHGRSAVALDSAAALIRHRGGDPLERAEFARLFAIGAPQQGLRAFLSRRSKPTSV
jgi:enoyl-CoA hydratase/carnithine racemase